MARGMLDTAWPRYANALPLIRQGAGAVEPREVVLRKVADPKPRPCRGPTRSCRAFFRNWRRATHSRSSVSRWAEGTTGLEREAYAAGWLVVGDLLKQGKSFAEIARIPSAEMPAVVRAVIETRGK